MSVVKLKDMTPEQQRAAERRRELVQKIADLFAEENATMDEALGALADVLGSTIAHGYRVAERERVLKTVLEDLQTLVRRLAGH